MRAALLATLIAIPCCAQEMRFVSPLPPSSGFTQTSNIYKQAGDKALSFDLFLPSAPARPQRLPVFIIFNGFGGAFMRTSPQSVGWAKAATAHGFAAITAETTPNLVADDFDSLTAYLKQHAEELHVDSDVLVVIAWSGNVGVGLPTIEDAKRKAIKAAVIYYGSADLTQHRLDLPVLFVRAGLDQPATNQSLDRRVSAGITANAPWTLLNYPGGRHGFDVFDDNDLSREIIEETFRFALQAISDSHQAALQAGLPAASAAGALATGDSAKAAVLYQALANAHPQDARILLAYANALSSAQRYKDARAQYDLAKAIGGLGPRDLGLPAAKACALDRDPEAALEWLKTIPSFAMPASVQTDPVFAALKDRPDFQAMFKK